MMVISKVQFRNLSHKIVVWALAVKFISGECHRTSLMRSQHWFMSWLGAIRHQVIHEPVLTKIYFTIWRHNDLIYTVFCVSSNDAICLKLWIIDTKQSRIQMIFCCPQLMNVLQHSDYCKFWAVFNIWALHLQAQGIWICVILQI